MAEAPKRFYTEVTLLPCEDGYLVALDGRPAKTVGRRPLAAAPALAEALRSEWEAQADVIRAETMPLTRLHGLVLDTGDDGRSSAVDVMVQYAGSDLLCYRADETALAARQEASFAPFLERAEARGLKFRVTTGLLPVPQPETTLDALAAQLVRLDTAELVPRRLMTEVLGSAVLALFAEDDPDAAFAAARLDETVQAETWGLDSEAELREQALRRDFDAIVRYLTLEASR